MYTEAALAIVGPEEERLDPRRGAHHGADRAVGCLGEQRHVAAPLLLYRGPHFLRHRLHEAAGEEFLRLERGEGALLSRQVARCEVCLAGDEAVQLVEERERLLAAIADLQTD